MFKFEMIGHLGQDAQARHTAGTNQVAINFSVAYSERWKDSQGMVQERTTWVNCTLWRDQAKLAIVPYLKKGQLVYIEGRPEARGYTSRDGQVRGDLRMHVSNVELLGSTPQRPSDGGTPQQPQSSNSLPSFQNAPPPPPPPQPAAPAATMPEGGFAADFAPPTGLPDDLPF